MKDKGWILVLRKHGGTGGRNLDLGNEIHMIFVDNLPESMDPKGLYNIFTNFGIVKDVFIPNKRRKLTKSRFGFVRYACPVAANMAVQKAHGIWCDNRALKVKIADFVQGKEDNQKSVITSIGRRDFATTSSVTDTLQRRNFATTSRVTNTVQRGKSYAQILTGSGLASNSNISIQAYEEGNGWLYESAIVRLKSHILAGEFKEELKNRGMGNVYVRDGGGRDIVLTFESAGSLKEKLKSMEGWIQSWCESVKVWQLGMILDQERSVWLTCYGVPRNLWSSKTFSSIERAWGEVIGIDEDTSRMTSFHISKVRIATKCMESINTTINLQCKGIDFPVKVCEEQVVISEVIYKQCKCFSEQPQTKNSNSNGEEQDQEQRSIVGSKEGEDVVDVEGHGGGELDNTDVVRAKGLRVGNDDHTATDGQLRELSISRVEESIMSIGQLDCLQKQPGGSGEACGCLSVKSGPTPIQIQIEGNQIVVDDVVTPGFMKSLSGPEKDAPGLNLEVLLRKAHVLQCGNILGHRYSELSDPKDQLIEEDEVQNSKGKEAHDSVVKESYGVATCSMAVVDQTRKNTIKEKGKGMVKY
ncbi:hypothetical protein CsSME_00021263 [Camellia sinensis var. sinensis]